jgi:hypothetical protein
VTVPRGSSEFLHFWGDTPIDPTGEPENTAQPHAATGIRLPRPFYSAAQSVNRKITMTFDYDVAVVVAELVQDE